MKVLRVFLLGLVFGWWMKWIIDRIYANNDLQRITEENALLKDRIRSLERPKADVSLVRKTTATPQPDQRPEPARASTKTSSQKDDLKKIKGIGPVTEKKLNAAGVVSFEQFSRLTTQELQNILGISKRVVQSANNLISQAKKLAQQKSKR
jgi:predicted flap endonuclease-1-like 5' DNA nuclease